MHIVFSDICLKIGMEGYRVIQEVRQTRLEAVGISNAEPETTPLIKAAPETTVSPTTNKNKGCNAFAVLMNYTLAIGCIIAGAGYINDCPVEKRIPIILIVFGSVMTIGRLLNSVYDYRSIFADDVTTRWRPLNMFFCYILFAIFVTLCYFLISIIKKQDEKNYCDYTLACTAGVGSLFGMIFFVSLLWC